MGRSGRYLHKKTRDRIEETENMIRDIVSEVLSKVHGPDWENKVFGRFSEEEIKEMEQRRKDERNKLSSQLTSSKLLDYAHILDLKRIISDNWSEFASIFQSRDTTMVYFDTLNKFRNPIAHTRLGILEHQYSLVIGISGELGMFINRWRAGYRRHVRSYYCEFRFSALDQNDAQAKAEDWSRRVESLSSKDVTLSRSNEFGEEKLIRLSKGQVKISKPQTIPQSGRVPYWTSVIQARFSTKLALNDILTNGNQPCWSLLWNLREDINVHELVSEIKDLTGMTPSSSSGLGAGRIVSAEYSVDVENQRIRIFLAGSDYGKTSSSVGLIPESSDDKGFFFAHEIFSPDTILSFLRGEMKRQKFRTMVDEARGFNNDGTVKG